MSSQIFDLANLYQKTFGTRPYVINQEGQATQDISEGFHLGQAFSSDQFTPKGSLLKENYLGVEILLPIRFFQGTKEVMYLPYAVVKISGSKTIVSTPLAERRGTVHEVFNIDDYKVGIKGFLINPDRKFPEAELMAMRELFELGQAVRIDNALTNIFLTDPTLADHEQRMVVIKSLDFPEVTGGRIHVRPFSMELESDCIFTLELDEEL